MRSREREVSVKSLGACAGTACNKVFYSLWSVFCPNPGAQLPNWPSFCCICAKTPTPNYFNGRRQLGTAGNCCLLLARSWNSFLCPDLLGAPDLTWSWTMLKGPGLGVASLSVLIAAWNCTMLQESGGCLSSHSEAKQSQIHSCFPRAV
jgi:hypothetical protein